MLSRGSQFAWWHGVGGLRVGGRASAKVGMHAPLVLFEFQVVFGRCLAGVDDVAELGGWGGFEGLAVGAFDGAQAVGDGGTRAAMSSRLRRP